MSYDRVKEIDELEALMRKNQRRFVIVERIATGAVAAMLLLGYSMLYFSLWPGAFFQFAAALFLLYGGVEAREIIANYPKRLAYLAALRELAMLLAGEPEGSLAAMRAQQERIVVQLRKVDDLHAEVYGKPFMSTQPA